MRCVNLQGTGWSFYPKETSFLGRHIGFNKKIIKKTSLIYNHKGNNKRNTFKSPVMYCHG